MLTKIISFVKRQQYNIYLVLCAVLLVTLSYNLGRIASRPKGELRVIENADIFTATSDAEPALGENGSAAVKPTPVLDLRVVVSKNSDKYHFLWCSGAKRIKEENKIYFPNEDAAQKAGYTLAGNCNR